MHATQDQAVEVDRHQISARMHALPTCSCCCLGDLSARSADAHATGFHTRRARHAAAAQHALSRHQCNQPPHMRVLTTSKGLLRVGPMQAATKPDAADCAGESTLPSPSCSKATEGTQFPWVQIDYILTCAMGSRVARRCFMATPTCRTHCKLQRSRQPWLPAPCSRLYQLTCLSKKMPSHSALPQNRLIWLLRQEVKGRAGRQ